MPEKFFKFAARVLEHLGTELISSDDIALYELIKNGFDAGSRIVDVRVRFAVDPALIRFIHDRVADTLGDMREDVAREDIGAAIEDAVAVLPSDFQEQNDVAKQLVGALPVNGPLTAHLTALRTLNTIIILDRGVGMSASGLEANFLTIGTPHRYEQHKEHIAKGTPYPDGVTPTGEKGIGRLSAMRLGRELEIRTCQADSLKMQVLRIDWRKFGAENPLEAGRVPVLLNSVVRSTEDLPHGTVLTIADLNSAWSRTKTENVGRYFVSKFVDPFRKEQRRKVHIFWNDERLILPSIGQEFLQAAHNKMHGSVKIDKAGRFEVTVDFTFQTPGGVRKPKTKTYTSADFGGLTDAQVRTVGPFDFDLYHYNRARLAAIPGVADREEFREWLNEWSGGLKIYRDGIRVMPYGEAGNAQGRSGVNKPFDDWLELDSSALRGKGFTVNRLQVVGAVHITRAGNELLRDQANREGLIDNISFQTFRDLLKRLIADFRTLVDLETRAREHDLGALRERTVEAQSLFEDQVDNLLRAAEEGDREAVSKAKRAVVDSLRDMRSVVDETQDALVDQKLNRVEVLELAATGLSAEAFAHDLEATLDEALHETKAGATAAGPNSTVGASLSHLRGVFQTLRNQIALIKPGPARRRRRKSDVNMATLIDQVANHHALRFKRHGVSFSCATKPASGVMIVSVVEGHIRQVLDNLVRNSLYWLLDTRQKHQGFAPEIRVTIDCRNRSVIFADNGVGIAREDAEWVFERFTTRRPAGRGLGLYIAKELCAFNDIGISLDASAPNRWKRLNSFVLDCSRAAPKGE